MRGRAGPGRLRHVVLESIRAHRLWNPGERVAVAVSGGLDSVCLLDLLLATRDVHGAVLSVVTVDHGTRPGSAYDADFVAALASDLGLEVERARAALGPEASEEVARDARYRVFDALDVDRVALAHHRDDQAETVLLHLLRGAGTRGLAAMTWSHGRRVRPLLAVPRGDLVAWAAHRGLAWREDPTNAEARFLRNRVRHEVMPLLESLRPGASESLARSARVAGEDDAWLDAMVAEAARDLPEALDAEWVATRPLALVGRVLRARVPAAGARHVRAIRAAASRGAGVVELPGGARWIVLNGRVHHEGVR